MRRVQLLELEDQPWFPHFIRRYMQEWLELVGNLRPSAYVPFVQLLKENMARLGEHHLIDLCSGGAGPVRAILRLMRHTENYPVTATLTDLFPNPEAFERARCLSDGQIDFICEPVDATRVQATLRGFRLLCNCFHHFDPKSARAILANAVEDRRGIAVVEVVDRSLTSMVSIMIGVLFCALCTPFQKPFRLSRILLSLVLPVVPLCSLFDGFVSCFRVYSIEELRELKTGLDRRYHWQVGRVPMPGTPFRLTYLIGVPTED